MLSYGDFLATLNFKKAPVFANLKSCNLYIYDTIHLTPMKTNLLLFGLLLTSVIASAQTTYYKMPNGKIINQELYIKVKTSLAQHGKVEEIFTDTRTAKDSIIKTVDLKVTAVNENGESFGPYAIHKKKIGQHFTIEKFKKANGKAYTATALNGKPTFINFWFTKCPPCIAEIPNLNSLKAKFGDKVNFIAITFDDADMVKKFLVKKPLNFEQITDARPQLTEMGIEAYPMNVLLDKDGKIINVYGEITYDEAVITSILTQMLGK